MLVIEDRPGIGGRIVTQLQLATFEYRAIGIAQHGNQHLARRRPIDIEILRVGGIHAIFQHVHPPGILGTDANVIRHEVDDVPHVVCTQRADEILEILARTDLRIERVVIHHIVAMHAARARPEVRRAIHVTDAEVGEVGNERGGLAKREFRIELQAVGGARHPDHSGVRRARSTVRRSTGRSKSQVTLQGASSLRLMAPRMSGCVANSTRPAGWRTSGAE